MPADVADDRAQAARRQHAPVTTEAAAATALPLCGVDRSEPRTCETRTGQVAWHEVDRGERGGQPASPPPLLCLHGFTGHRDDFVGVAAALGRRRRVLVPDLRGHGDSDSKPGASGWTFEQLVMDQIAFLDALGVERVDLLGHSMGGFVALRLALAHPERLRRLVLVCTGPETPRSIPRAAFARAAEIGLVRGMGDVQSLIERVSRPRVSQTVAAWGERYWQHHRRRLGAMSPESYRGLGRAFFDSTSLVERLHEIDRACLVLVGAADRDWLPGADLLEQNLPRVRRQTIPEAEHHPHNENPVAFLEAVTAHLETSARDHA